MAQAPLIDLIAAAAGKRIVCVGDVMIGTGASGEIRDTSPIQ